MMINSFMKRYASNDSGQIAVITAITAIPLMLGVSIAVDSHRMGLERVKLQAALDGAAIAAIADQTLTPAEQSEHAEARFWSNMSDEQNVKFSIVSSDRQRIEIKAEVEIPTLFAGIIGRDAVMFEADAAAEVTRGETVCMMALDPDSRESFSIKSGADFNANCSVHVNSLHLEALTKDNSNSLARATNWCVGGNVFVTPGDSEGFQPFVNTECATLGDPYENLEIPVTVEPCVNQEDINALLNDWKSNRDAVQSHNDNNAATLAYAEQHGFTFTPVYYEKFRLQPGNYCNGLFLSGKEFILDPGEYHFTNGDLTLAAGTLLSGEGVTFIMYDDAALKMTDGSELDIKAPTSGPLDGLLFAQQLDNKSIYNPTFPNALSTITSGSSLNFLGTVYLPSHKIEFVQGTESEAHAPATSFIAHQIQINNGANITVSVDHVAAGISPIEPRSDDGVRLVQ